jgi:hypothetical protein
MKNCLLFLFQLTSVVAFSQNIWNQQLPLKIVGNNFAYSSTEFVDGRYLLIGNQQIIEVDQLGSITSNTNIPNGPNFPIYLRKNESPAGKVFFLMGYRTMSTDSRLHFFNPIEGKTGQVVLPDSLGSISAQAPTMLSLNDTTVMVFGRKFAYKVGLQGDTAFSIVWQKPLSIPGNGATSAVVQVVDDFMLFSVNGDIIRLNNAGEQVFTKHQPFKFYSAAILADGIITCGANAAQKAVLVKLTFKGDLIWWKTYDDLRYNDVAVTHDGGFVMTGTSSAGNMVLKKTTGNGEQVWSKEYQAGFGAKVIPMPDGGYFLSAKAPGYDAFAIKTDALGVTGVPDNEYYIQNRQLKTEGIKATFEPSAALFSGGPEATLIASPDSSVGTIAFFSPWIGGVGSDGELHVAAENYFSSSYSDFHAGVVDGHAGDFRRVWLAKKNEIDALRRDFLIDQVLDAPVPYDLLTWPAKGNVHNRYNIDFTKIKTDKNLQSAPFEDVNSDGLYNVFDGDYPRIKGDQMVWYMLNDDSIHFQSHGLPFRVDLCISAYVYDCQQNESVKRSLFVDFDIINRSSLSYDSVYFGLVTDFNIGCTYDDNFGSIPASNSFYAYNRDASDNSCNVGQSFPGEMPVQSVTIQNKKLNHFIYFNGNFGSSPPYIMQPSFPEGYYHFLQGNWGDGTPVTFGGSGYNPGSTDQTDFVFPSNPPDSAGWSMYSVIPFDQDRRTLGSHGPFSFVVGDTFSMGVAFTAHRNIPLPYPDIFGLVKPAIDQLTTWANNDVLGASLDLGVVQEISVGQALTLGGNIPGATFLWSTGDTSSTITIAHPREYTVTVTNQAGCQSVEKVLVKSVVGANNPTLDPNWTIFPNPATDILQVSCATTPTGDGFQAILRNAQGAVVKQAQSAASTFTVPLHGLPAGLYWLELWQNETFSGSKKCIVFAR